MSLQDQLISAMQNNTRAKIRANIMQVLAREGGAEAIRPMLQAINTRPLLHAKVSRNDGNIQLDAALALCKRFPKEAKPYLVEILNELPPKSPKFMAVLFDANYIAAIAKREAAAHILSVLYGGEETLASNLFANVKRDK